MKSVQQIIAHYPPKDWFIDIIKTNDNTILTSDFLNTFENIIKKAYDDNNYLSLNYELEIIYELSWEHINIGMYKDVPMIWRLVFATTCLLIVFVKLRSLIDLVDLVMLKKCLYLCDMSLMMGGELNKDLNLAALIASKIHVIIANKSDKILRDDRELLIDSDFDPHKYLSHTITKNVEPLTRLDNPSISEFLEIMHKGNPVILTNVINEWPAIKNNKWSVNFIKEICGFRTVPIEIGSTYADSDWTQKLMTINDFISQYFYKPENSTKAYLAQHYLFSQISELNNDINIPDYCFIHSNDDEIEVDINGWFGPSGTVSPLHQDPKHNFLCQIFGEKYIKLFLPIETEFLYPNSTTMLKNTSKVDIINPDLESFPLFSKAKGFDGFLKTGEILFIPPKCWHYVRSISSSFSVNFWWNYN